MSKIKVTTIADPDNDNTALSIDSSGVVTFSNTPLGFSTSPTITATASGALSNGDKVVLNSDGTVSVISGTDQSTGSVGSLTEANTCRWNKATYDTNSNKVVVAYRNGSDLYCAVGTVSGTSISFGTSVDVGSIDVDNSTYRFDLTFDSNSNKVVIVSMDNLASDYGKGVVGTVSGTSISFGTPTVFASVTVTQMAATFDSTNNKVVVAYMTGSDLYTAIGTVSGTSISFGTPVATITGTTVAALDVTFDSDQGSVVVGCCCDNDYTKFKAGQVSGTSITYGSALEISPFSGEIRLAYDTTTNKPAYAIEDAGSGVVIVSQLSVSGTTITEGTRTALDIYGHVANDFIDFIYNPADDVFYLLRGYNSGGRITYLKVNGLVFQEIGSAHFQSYYDEIVLSRSYWSAVLDPDTEQVICSNSNSTNVLSFCVTPASGNLIDSNFIGISDGAYSDAATATIQVTGAVDDAQSSLTVGAKYYAGVTGALTQDSQGIAAQYAGLALSATELLIKG